MPIAREQRRHREATLRDVAVAANVHVSTASRALDPSRSQSINELTAERVRAAARELGYTPHIVARGLKRGTTMTVGVVVADLENPFIGPVIRGIASVLEEHEFVPLVSETFDDARRLKRLVHHFAARRVDAIVVAAGRLGDARFLREAARRPPPVVLAVRGVPGSGLPAVTHDDRRGAELAVEHLAGLGHRALAQLQGPTDVLSFVDRTKGYLRSVAAASLDDVSPPDSAVEPTVAEGRRLMALALTREDGPPTGVFAQNDLMAIGAIDAIRAAGLRCPDDISVIGYNDAPLVDHVAPPLSTIRLPGAEIGRLAAEMALALVRTPGVAPGPVSVAPELVVRESTARPPTD